MKKKFWMVWDRTPADPKSSVYAVYKDGSMSYSDQYSSLESAIEKAREYAAKSINQEYIVMEAVMFIKAETPVVSMMPARRQIEEEPSGDDEVDAEQRQDA